MVDGRQSTVDSAEGLAALLRDAGGPVRIAGAGTKSHWGNPCQGPSVSTRSLDQVVEHNVGDLTAVVEAGVTLNELRERFGEESQMIALDPPGDDATIGGI